MMNGKNNKQKRDLAEDEARVLRLIQDMYGRNNKPSECFQAKDGGYGDFRQRPGWTLPYHGQPDICC